MGYYDWPWDMIVGGVDFGSMFAVAYTGGVVSPEYVGMQNNEARKFLLVAGTRFELVISGL